MQRDTPYKSWCDSCTILVTYLMLSDLLNCLQSLRLRLSANGSLRGRCVTLHSKLCKNIYYNNVERFPLEQLSTRVKMKWILVCKTQCMVINNKTKLIP